VGKDYINEVWTHHPCGVALRCRW